MSLGYRLAYRLHLTPWENAGVGFGPQLAVMLDREQGADTPPFGKALDIGCGTGDHSITLAQRGWQVTGIDSVPLALDKAREKARRAGVDVTLMEADVTALGGTVGRDYRFLLDVGCFHGLKPQQRAAYAREVTAVARTDAAILLFAFGPGRRGPLPRGVSRGEVETAFGGWHMTDDDPADTSGMPKPLRKSNPRWFRLQRS